MLSVEYIQSLAASHADIIYILIILGVFLEGEIVVILAGVFAYLGSIDTFMAFVTIFTGGLIKSVTGYSLGYFLQRKYLTNNILKQAECKILTFFPNFLKKPFRSILVSRFLILGMYWFTLIYAGYKKIKLKTFIWAEVSSLVVWSIIMFGLGFFFSHTALMVSKDIRNFVIIILTFFVAFLVLEKIITLVVGLFSLKINSNKKNEYV
jgi:membrane protein DedA with SNARE-associated domain